MKHGTLTRLSMISRNWTRLLTASCSLPNKKAKLLLLPPNRLKCRLIEYRSSACRPRERVYRSRSPFRAFVTARRCLHRRAAEVMRHRSLERVFRRGRARPPFELVLLRPQQRHLREDDAVLLYHHDFITIIVSSPSWWYGAIVCIKAFWYISTGTDIIRSSLSCSFCSNHSLEAAYIVN
jgi:hypothetical protein